MSDWVSLAKIYAIRSQDTGPCVHQVGGDWTGEDTEVFWGTGHILFLDQSACYGGVFSLQTFLTDPEDPILITSFNFYCLLTGSISK